MLRRQSAALDLSDPKETCTHGIVFPEKAMVMSASQVRAKYPRGHFPPDKPCPQCGFVGIYYASYGHYIAGDY